MTKQYKLVHLFPPSFVTFGEQKYLIPGWIPVDPDTTFSDVEHINPYAAIKSETFEIEGSRGANYTVTVTKSNGKNRVTCTCPGSKFRGNCKHIKSIKEQKNIL